MRLDWKNKGDVHYARDPDSGMLLADVVRVAHESEECVASVYNLRERHVPDPAAGRRWCAAMADLGPVVREALTPEVQARVKVAQSGEVYVSGPATDSHSRPIDYIMVPVTKSNARTFLAACLAALGAP